MKPLSIFEYIFIDEYSATPKYLQISNSIMKAIEAGQITKDQLLPSINELSNVLEVSRDTAERGYKHLKKIGLLGSVPGKGYYIINTDLVQTLKIFLLFNKLSAHKKIIYDAFVKAIGDHIAVDFYIYNNDFSLFKKLLNEKKDSYSHYVIIPHFLEDRDNAHEVINTIPKEKLVLLDKQVKGVNGEYAAVYQNFDKDIYTALESALSRLSNYNTLKVLFPKRSYFPVEILKGFNRFCHQYAFTGKVVYDIGAEPIAEGEVYIILMEDDLVTVIEKIISQKLIVGEQVGVISYNETPLKKIILNGITTISTDFEKMGAMAAELILQNLKQQVEVPFYLTLRASL
ncbi:transcriptional regulator [Mucilaginibacter hurinus]|uniref:Transcriptional regulator n=1 Tax=Mucilaginibacter hurinus TaxID=2201324 RepID=A0A367GK87_9SPHI|nr:winged helix-turn-helix domain-containing protein [Mucilaginibacter hurinus]RCH53879.1 transcriptional regulator [Mucilaginibacter hurinus]